MVGYVPALVGIVGFPTAVGIAITRYRLYDIDILINRTLVYGTLTAMLVAVYIDGIVLSQHVFVLLTGQQSTLAVVASTLVIAALFNPLTRIIHERLRMLPRGCAIDFVPDAPRPDVDGLSSGAL
jgi:hypothetical protein